MRRLIRIMMWICIVYFRKKTMFQLWYSAIFHMLWVRLYFEFNLPIPNLWLNFAMCSDLVSTMFQKLVHLDSNNTVFSFWITWLFHHCRFDTILWEQNLKMWCRLVYVCNMLYAYDVCSPIVVLYQSYQHTLQGPLFLLLLACCIISTFLAFG